jgi:hypothetical protein
LYGRGSSWSNKLGCVVISSVSSSTISCANRCSSSFLTSIKTVTNTIARWDSRGYGNWISKEEQQEEDVEKEGGKSICATSITKLRSPSHRTPPSEAKTEAKTIASLLVEGTQLAMNFSRSMLGDQAVQEDWTVVSDRSDNATNQDKDVFLWANDKETTTATTAEDVQE